jgi:hypothetical protein
MEVKIRRWGCLESAGCVLSFGVLPLMLFLQINNLPRQLTADALVTRSGKTIRWSEFTKAKITHHYVKATASSRGQYNGTRYELTYPGGILKFYTLRVANNTEVVEFIRTHLPPNVVVS